MYTSQKATIECPGWLVNFAWGLEVYESASLVSQFLPCPLFTLMWCLWFVLPVRHHAVQDVLVFSCLRDRPCKRGFFWHYLIVHADGVRLWLIQIHRLVHLLLKICNHLLAPLRCRVLYAMLGILLLLFTLGIDLYQWRISRDSLLLRLLRPRRLCNSSLLFTWLIILIWGQASNFLPPRAFNVVKILVFRVGYK